MENVFSRMRGWFEPPKHPGRNSKTVTADKQDSGWRSAKKNLSTPDGQFLICRAGEGSYQPMTGLRDWLSIRDLGLNRATHGQYDAWTTRANAMGQSTGRHYHNYDFQIMFILEGWVKMYYEDQGEVVLEKGDFVYHPRGQIHDLMDYSEDIHILEMASPAFHHSIDA